MKEIGNYEEALKDFKTVLKLSPSNAKAYTNLGNLQKEQKNMMKQEDHMRKRIGFRREKLHCI